MLRGVPDHAGDADPLQLTLFELGFHDGTDQ
jgi:hypothetical protein